MDTARGAMRFGSARSAAGVRRWPANRDALAAANPYLRRRHGRIAAVATRVLAIFPDMNTAAVERFRTKWDPLAAAVPAHITVGFPFAWPGPVSRLAEALQPVLTGFTSFALELATPTIWEDEYLFLLVTEGREQVRRLHGSIYGQVLRRARRPSHFIPHMTVGRHADKAALAVGISETAEINLPLTGRALSLTVYRRDDDGRRVRELGIPFGAAS
jgi:2'-5' RNA ligase